MECRTVSRQKIFSYKECGSRLSLKNINEVESISIKVDGCEINDNSTERCDYLHIAKEIEFYIELKGQNIKKALSQIESTIKLLGHKDRQRKSYIICTRSPLASTEIQAYKRKFMEKYKCDLKVKSSPYEEEY